MSSFMSPFSLLHHHMGSMLDAFERENFPYDSSRGYRGYRRQPDLYRSLYDPTPLSYRYYPPQPHYHMIDFSLPLPLDDDMQAEECTASQQPQQQQRIKSPLQGKGGNRALNRQHQQQQASPQPGQPSSATTTGNGSNSQQQQVATRSDEHGSDPLNTLFRTLFRPSSASALMRTPSELSALEKLRVDVEEDPSGMTVKAEIAGLAKEDVKLTVKDHVLTIAATKQSKTEENQQQGSGSSGSAAGKEPAEEKKEGEDAQPAAQQQQQQPSTSSRVLHRELYYGSVSRSIRLPRQADVQQISAEAKDGLLTVRVPYKQTKESEQQTITIN